LIEGKRLRSGGEAEVAAVARVNGLSPETLAAEIRAAAVKIEAEGIENPHGFAVGDVVP
jgi:hypothetical protein